MACRHFDNREFKSVALPNRQVLSILEHSPEYLGQFAKVTTAFPIRKVLTNDMPPLTVYLKFRRKCHDLVAVFCIGVATLSLGCSPVVDSAKTSPSEVAKSQPKTPATPLPDLIRQTLQDNFVGRELSMNTNAAWQILHGVLAYDRDLMASENGARVNVLDRLFHGGKVTGWELLDGEPLPKTGRMGMKARLEPGSYIGQGHVDQWLAILAQIDVPLDQEVLVGDRKYTIEDWARQAQWDVPNNPVLEYSWTLMALMHYFPDEQTWQAKDGKTWDFEPLVEFEAKQDLTTSPCGGSHRLMGLAHALEFRRRHGGAITGGWKLAEEKLQQSIRIMREYQNSDGSFSCNFTERPGQTKDVGASISATGHMLEVLAFALPEQELSQPWVERSVVRLCNLLQATRNVDLDCGGLYHSLNGLRIYHERRFGSWNPN
jgi:hypothetical protein